MAELDTQARANRDAALQVLRTQRPHVFPERFGRGASERCIEVPWAAQWFAPGIKVLDIGFTMSSLDWLGLLLEVRSGLGAVIDAVDIVEPRRVERRYPEEWRDEIMSVPVSVGCVREARVELDHYDLVTCISTIEHIGFDLVEEDDPATAFKRGKSPEDAPMERGADVNRQVLEVFHRALKKGGRVILTAPMGKGGPALLRDSLNLFTRQWEYEEVSWRELTSQRGFRLVEQRFFRCSDDGEWTEVEAPRALVDRSSAMQPHAKGCALCALEKI